MDRIPNPPEVVSARQWEAARAQLLAREKQQLRAADALAAERRRLPMVEIAKRCDGCAMFVDNLGHLAHLRARGASFALVSRAPLPKLEAFKQRMGWDVPWYSSFESDFNVDFDVSPEQPEPDSHQDGERFGLSVFLRDGERIFRTYFTDRRGVEPLSSNWALLDLTPLGRQEEWEDSPEGRPQTPTYGWWRLHDEYDAHGS